MVASVTLVILLVPMLLVGIAVWMTSPGPPLFAQTRLGQGGREFRLLKFRTMRHGAHGSALTAPGDSRITPLGRMLRATCIDELPQLLNVLVGHMTLVGPRPQTPGFAARYPGELQRVFLHRPGLTGPGVVRFNDDDVLPDAANAGEDIEEFYLRVVVPQRVDADMAYCEQPTLLRTIGVLWDTALLALRRVMPRRRSAESDVASIGDSPAGGSLRGEVPIALMEEANRRSAGGMG